MMAEYVHRPADGLSHPAIQQALALADTRGRAHARGHSVIAISLGGCAEAIGTERQGAMRRSAHAHTAARDPLRGTICVKSPSPSRLVTPSERLTRLGWHEWAHIYTGQGHTQRWRSLLRSVGQKAEATQYDRKDMS